MNFVGPISAEGITTGIVGDQPPLLATVGLTNSQRITVTFPVTVSFGLSADTQLVNTGSAKSNIGGFILASDSVTLTIANDPPTAVDDVGSGFTTNEDTGFTTASVLTNDTDPNGDTLSVQDFDTTGSKGLVTNNGDGTFSYNPNGQFEDLDDGESATDTFTYTISDGNGGADAATVTITVNGKDDLPEKFLIYLPLILRNP